MYEVYNIEDSQKIDEILKEFANNHVARWTGREITHPCFEMLTIFGKREMGEAVSKFLTVDFLTECMTEHHDYDDMMHNLSLSSSQKAIIDNTFIAAAEYFAESYTNFCNELINMRLETHL